MPPKDDHVLVPGTCEYVNLHGEEGLKLQVELRWLIRWILDYPGRPNVITWISISERG